MNSLAASNSTMNGEAVCCWTSQLWATASIQFPTLLTIAPSQMKRKARGRRTPNMERRFIAEERGAALLKPPAEVYARAHARDPARHPPLAVVLGPPRL